VRWEYNRYWTRPGGLSLQQTPRRSLVRETGAAARTARAGGTGPAAAGDAAQRTRPVRGP
jgi:hypothetical protein